MPGTGAKTAKVIPFTKGDQDMNESDHDILITIRAQLTALTDIVRGNKEDTDTTSNDHETRIRRLERYLWLGLGGVSVISIAIHLLVK